MTSESPGRPRRNPVTYERWAERQVREAIERGDFDDLPGLGAPIPDLEGPHDELWWVREKLRREELSYLPPTLAMRKEVEDALERARRAGSERQVREIVGAVNERIRTANRTWLPGPPHNLVPYDVEAMVAAWERARPAPAVEPASVDPDPGPRPRRGWFGGRRPR